MERAIGKLGLKGMQIGSNINGKNLDEPEFEPVWAVANAHNAFCMVHPNNVAGIDLSEAIARKYGSGCPGCRKFVCTCPASEKP